MADKPGQKIFERFMREQHQGREDQDEEEDKEIAGLIQCSICLRTMTDPRAFPCLHSFCFPCMQRLAQSSQVPRKSIQCPMCKKSFQIPPSGLESLVVSNFYITTLKDRRSLQEKLIPCTSCNDSTLIAVARCLECKDFLCEKCYDAHKTVRVLKSHRVCTLKELKSGTVDFNSKPKEQFCEVHKGETLQLFCYTCNIPICKVCSEETHPSGSHTYVDLPGSDTNQQERIKELAEQCQQMTKEIGDAIDEAKKTKDEFKDSVQKAFDGIDESSQVARAQMLVTLDKRKQDLDKSLKRHEMEQSTAMNKHLEDLLFHQARLKNALDMVSQATSSSSFYATAELYATLTDTLQQLANLKPAKFCNESAGVRFAAYSSSSSSCSVPPLGYLTPRRSEELGTWVLLKHFASHRQINQGRGIVVHPNSDIAVADIGACRVAVYNKLGEFKFPIQGTRGRSNSGGTHGIAVSANGLYFVTGLADLVEVFNADGTLQYKFPAVSPSNVPSNQEDEESSLIGITVDAATQHVLVGDIKSKYISKHRLDGTHISSIQVDIQPWYIQVTAQSVIVASSYEEHAVNMYDQEGYSFITVAYLQDYRQTCGILQDSASLMILSL
ncbi:uncharacterized protein [Amphiura filiformis]|uniref:uncharacterized protein n=1 Tax=Amphiura filiformis TaxID=82378 RepID=UPI003B222823